MAFIACRLAPRGAGRLVKTLASLFLAAVVLPTTFAWKPSTHVYAANRAIEPILNGNDAIEINGKSYGVDPAVATAIRNYPNIYRAGVIGPDAFPDIYVGQAYIHPDTRGNNGLEPPTAADGHSFSYEWLRHIYQAGWAAYGEDGGNAKGQKVLAFTYGYLTHAAGDMWAHSFVNDFARGVFPSITEFSLLPIAARHIIVESYVGKATPPTEMDLPNTDGDLSEFVYKTLMLHGARGGFVDSAGFDAAKLGRGSIFDFFFGLRDDLQSAVEWFDDNPYIFVLEPVLAGSIYFYCDAWIDDIDNGLEAWPNMSQKIAVSLFQNNDYDAAGTVVSDYLTDHLLEMIGLPGWFVAIVGVVGDIMNWFSDLIEPLKESAKLFVDYVVKQAVGISITEMKEYLLTPENHINTPILGLEGTSTQVDALMGRVTPGTGEFNPNTFAPMANTITLSKMVLLAPAELNKILYDHRVGNLYALGVDDNDRENAMLGFIRTLDGHQQWRKGSSKGYENGPVGTPYGEGMLLWRDCLARDRVFRTLFLDWQNGGSAFPALGEAAENLSDTPAPDSSLTINGANVVVGPNHYVGNTTTFTLDAVGSHYWYTNEVLVKGQITGGSLTQNMEQLVVGPITGADGPYTVSYQGVGLCSDGPDHPGTLNQKVVVLDATPPTITVPVPNEDQWFDVNNTFNFDYNATDAGSGVDTTSATLDGVAIADGALVDMFLLDAGVHTLYVTAVDLIGNASNYTRQFEVHATIQGLKAAVMRAYAEKLITKPVTYKAMISQLDSAQKSLNNGAINTTKNKLAGTRDLVGGQLGSGVDVTFGNRFIGWCNDLIGRL